MALVTGRSPDSFAPLPEKDVDVQALWQCMERLASSMAMMEARFVVPDPSALHDGCVDGNCYHLIGRAASVGSTAPSEFPHLRDFVDGAWSQAGELSDSCGLVGSSRCSLTGAPDSSRHSCAQCPQVSTMQQHTAKSVDNHRHRNRHVEGDEGSSSAGPQLLLERQGAAPADESSDVSFEEDTGVAASVAGESDSSQGEALQAMRERLLNIRASLMRREGPEVCAAAQVDFLPDEPEIVHSPLRPLRLTNCSSLGSVDNRNMSTTASLYIWDDKENQPQSANSTTVCGNVNINNLCASAANSDPSVGDSGVMDCVGFPGAVFDENVPLERPGGELAKRSSVGACACGSPMRKSSTGISGGGVTHGCGTGRLAMDGLPKGRKSCPPRWWAPSVWLAQEQAPWEDSAVPAPPTVPQERPAIRPTQALARPCVLQRVR